MNSKQNDMKNALTAIYELKFLFKSVKASMTDVMPLMHLEHITMTLLECAREISELKTDLDESAENYDRLVSALLATDEPRAFGVQDLRPASAISIDEALKFIEAMNLKLREYQVLDDIPFGEVIPNAEMIEMQKRIVDLEIQLETRTEQLTSLQLTMLNSMAEIVAVVASQVRATA